MSMLRRTREDGTGLRALSRGPEATGSVHDSEAPVPQPGMMGPTRHLANTLESLNPWLGTVVALQWVECNGGGEYRDRRQRRASQEVLR
jgi:hypothetical protein